MIDIDALLKRNAQHLQKLQGERLHPEWGPVIEDWTDMFSYAAEKRAEEHRGWFEVRLSNTYVLSVLFTVVGLLFLYLMFVAASYISQLFGQAIWSGLLTVLIIGVPLGILVEFARRRVGR